jgi:hypothetical protein
MEEEGESTREGKARGRSTLFVGKATRHIVEICDATRHKPTSRIGDVIMEAELRERHLSGRCGRCGPVRPG